MTNQWVDFTVADLIPEWAQETVPILEDSLRQTAPVGPGPTGGRFANSIEAHVSEGGMAVDAEGDNPPGAMLLHGSVPHEIHGNPWLVFEGKEGLTFLNNDLGKFVHHPGTQPSDFVERTIDAIEEERSEALMNRMSARWAEGSAA